MTKKLDLVGLRFGRLVVLEEAGRTKGGNVCWLCRCDCGTEVIVRSGNLRYGSTVSCGCYHRECQTKHGMHGTRLYHVWAGMLKRTGIYKGASEQERRVYIDRGITVCEEWLVFENFCKWALGNGYRDGLEIDRIDNDKGYYPENCRWVTLKENCNNRRNTLRLPNGMPLALFCSEIGIQTCENGKSSKQYARIYKMYSTSHKIHPELIAKANEYLTLLRRLKASLDLLADIRSLERNATPHR